MNAANNTVDFFPTRNQAKTALPYIDGGKFKDFGSQSPKGERWAVISQKVADHNVTKPKPVSAPAPKKTAIVTTDVPDTTKPTDVGQATASVVSGGGDPAESKTVTARRIVIEMYGQQSFRPIDIIKRIETDCGFSRRGASTYYYNAKRDLGL